MPVVTLTLTTVGHNLMRDTYTGIDNARPTYFALGSGTSAPSAGQTKLDAETFRKKVTSFTNGASTGEALINCYIAQNDAVNANIQEVAVFGGNTASAAANSGKMLGRALYAHNPKTNLESIQLQLDLTT